MPAKTASDLPETLVQLLEWTNDLSVRMSKRRLTPAEVRSIKRQLPGINRLLVESHGAVLEWFGGTDVWDGMMDVVQQARERLSTKKK